MQGGCRYYRRRSSKIANGLIPRIALDQCRFPERYRTRVPAFARNVRRSECFRPKQAAYKRLCSHCCDPKLGARTGGMPWTRTTLPFQGTHCLANRCERSMIVISPRMRKWPVELKLSNTAVSICRHFNFQANCVRLHGHSEATAFS